MLRAREGLPAEPGFVLKAPAKRLAAASSSIQFR
jgi:hypothetical protein